MADLKRVYWDANVWLGLINGEPNKKRAVEYIYRSAKSGSHEIWTSTLSLVEVFRIQDEEKLSRPLPEENLDKIEQMFQQDLVKLVPVDLEIGKSARRLLRETRGLRKSPDAIHLASALRWPVEVPHTYDGNDLLHLDGTLKNKMGVPLRIAEPEDPSDGPLFSVTATR